MDLTFRPIQQWPQPLTKSRKSGQFRASYPETLRLLDRELVNLLGKQYSHAPASPELNQTG